MSIDEAKASVGARVTYHPSHGGELHGEIRYAGPSFVFVRFDTSMIAKATAPHLLTLDAAA